MRWWVRYDAPTGEWYALPMWREWVVARRFSDRPNVFGPRGMRLFPTLAEAMDYAHDLHSCYQDGWMP